MNGCADVATLALTRLGRALLADGYRFTTVTPATHARVNERPENAWARSVEDVLGWSRPFEKGLLPQGYFDLLEQAGQLEREAHGWKSRVRASTLNDRLFFHSAFPTRDADAVFFGPDTVRFVNALDALLGSRAHPVKRAIDLCTGAGPAAIAIAARCPHAEVQAGDINAAALQLTQVNAAVAETPNVVPVHADLLTGVEGTFDLIVANPPYLLDSTKRAYRHGGGQTGEGLSLSIIEQALPRLAPGGSLMLYTGSTICEGEDRFLSGARVRLAPGDFRWSYVEVDPDVFGEELLRPAYQHADRIAAVVLTVTRELA